MEVWLTFALFLTSGVIQILGQNGLDELSVPQGLTLQPDLSSQTLSLTWESDSSFFDIEVFHTELMNVVLNETFASEADPATGQHVWMWRSALPLECTSHSVQIRARNQQAVSQWSPLQTIPGSDLPEKSAPQMYPQDKVVSVGSNMTFCCIVGEGMSFGLIQYQKQQFGATRLSRRSYATTIANLSASRATGTNVVCSSKTMAITGAVVFVGYPPGDEGLVCETRDLTSAECSWKKGRDTHLKTKRTRTKYTLNGRDCLEANKGKIFQCNWTSWEDSWTLVGQNLLGSVQLNDSAPLADRVYPLAPVHMTAVDVKAWNVTLKWSWTVAAYEKLEMICQLKFDGRGLTSLRNYSGTGLSSVVLDGLWPDVDYTVSVRCGSLHNFWKWGDMSASYSIRTKMDCPDPPDVWVYRDSETTGRVLWKHLSESESHGTLDGYEVYHNASEEDRWTTVSPFHNTFSYPITLTNSSDITVAVAARNPAGLSQPSTVTVPAYRADSQLTVSELSGTNGGFDLSWQPDVNVSRRYVVEWIPTGCTGLCSVDWLKVPESNTSVRVQTDSLEAGVQYTLSLYALSAGTTTVLQRWNGYIQEMIPAQSVDLSANQTGSDVLLSWNSIPMKQQRGYIRGYNIYLANAGHLKLIANVSDPEVRSYRITGLSMGSYKFLVKAYNSAGEDAGTPVSIKLEMNADMLVIGILVSLGGMFCLLILISIFCYRKREWVKKAFYPEIPGPKVPGDWSSPQGLLDVKPPPHSLVLVGTPEEEFIKGGLVPVPEKDEYSDVEVDTDSDEPAPPTYYQVSGDGCHTSDSSGSSTFSVGSTQTEITYTGIQSPTSLHGAYGGGGYKPQMQPAMDPQFESDFEDNSNVGYKPQCSWQHDSPDAENLSGSLGSPTSVTSSQFLIPESSEEKPQSSNTWFHSFLSGRS